MSKDFAGIAQDVIAGVGLLQRGAPDMMKAFGSLSTAATASKAIDTKTKELMAPAMLGFRAADAMRIKSGHRRE
jgi:alkylhydroperoxidase/carboxymuconolactone decarboxylase family protein YurZ